VLARHSRSTSGILDLFDMPNLLILDHYVQYLDAENENKDWSITVLLGTHISVATKVGVTENIDKEAPLIA